MAVEDPFNQETFRRVVGTRQHGAPGEPPGAAVRSALAKLARASTGAPKGVFKFRSHEEANAQREAWTVAQMAKIATSAEDTPAP